MNKRHRSPMPLRVKAVTLAVASCFAVSVQTPAFANPTGFAVVNGQVTFNYNGNTLNVTNTPGSIINWQRFSIGTNELTRFIQQSASSSVLNRVIGVDPSLILGALQSNGRVFLINPNGILFGAGAQIDVGGLVASTLNLSNQDFLAGRLRFTDTPGAGSVVNNAAITTPTGGQVYLIAPSVQNSGIITSPQGEVILAAGRSVELVVHAAAQPNSPVIERLGMNLVRVLPDTAPPANPNEPFFLHVAAPSGKAGYVDAQSVSPLGGDQICYTKQSGAWKITGYLGGAAQQ